MATSSICPQRRKVIESRARFLQLELWNNRQKLWPGNAPDDPTMVLEPGVALAYIGFDIESSDLGQQWVDGMLADVAGVIDIERKLVVISTKPDREVQLFTAAHELGHALLHSNHKGLHRDLPVRGPKVRKNVVESEADYFASCFLMPEKVVQKRFVENFLMAPFVLNEQTAFALGAIGLEAAKVRLRSLRDLSRVLAEAVSYNGFPRRALKAQFCVSTEAMAIRLEELRLV